MPLVTSYTEDELATWLLGSMGLGQVATVLAWTEDNLVDVVARSVRLYGVTDIADVTDVGKLEALAAREAWRAAIRALVTVTDFTVDGESVKASDMLKGAQVALDLAETEASAYADSGPAISVATISVEGNPYDYGVSDTPEWQAQQP